MSTHRKENMMEFIQQFKWHIYHDCDNPRNHDPLSALAYQDSFIRYIPLVNQNKSQPIAILHFYPYPKPTILLGNKDTLLPKVQAGYQFLKNAGYQLVLRPHGGLAVVNDLGIINFSLVLQMPEGSISIDTAYEAFIQIISELFHSYQLTIQSYEIPESYCPGKYDIVIADKKIGGTAQRRFKDGLSIAGYLSLDGNQAERAQLIHDFYQISKADTSYPKVDPSAMTTISAAMNKPYTQGQFLNDIIHLFDSYTQTSWADFTDPMLDAIYEKQYPSIKKRNQKLHEKGV